MQIPIYKVGIVLFRQNAQGLEFFILRPKAKNPGEMAPFVLPRGSRQYQDAQGQWLDVRDDAGAISHAATLEPLTRTLAREAEEEAGLPPALLNALQASSVLKELGARVFASTNKPPYPVHWFAAQLTEHQAAKLASPEDAAEWCWASFADIQSLVTQKDFSPGYVPILQEIVASII